MLALLTSLRKSIQIPNPIMIKKQIEEKRLTETEKREKGKRKGGKLGGKD